MEVFSTVLSALNEGFIQTLKLFAVTLIGAIPLGLLICFGSMSSWRPLRVLRVRKGALRFGENRKPGPVRTLCRLLGWILRGILNFLGNFKPVRALFRLLVWVIRGTPLMLQLIIIFYIPGMVLEGGSPWPSGEKGRFLAAAIAFIINYACYFSEIYRGGIQGVPTGQEEAGLVLGMTKSQIFFKITLLQMVKRIIPPMSNEIITLVKDTSIARIISFQEVIWAGYAFMKGSHGYSGLWWPLLFTGVYYLLFNGLLTLLFGWLEKRLDYFR